MFPVLLAIGPITISSLGFFIALAFFFGGFGVWKKAKEEHFEDDEIFDVIFLTFFGGIIGARIFFILLNFGKFGLDLSKWLNLTYSNRFYFLGFLFGFIYVLKLISKKRKWDFFAFLDYSVLGIITAQILVRIGQFLDMSYIGNVTNFPLGINFPGIEGARHPLALYEVALLFFVKFLIKWLDKRYRLFKWYQSKRGEAAPGFLFLSYFLIFSSFQFFIEFLNIKENILWIFSSYQLLLILLIIGTLFLFWLRAGNKMNFGSGQKEELEVIRKPIEKEKPEKRERRFVREKVKSIGFK